jgi:hypothetical protein
VSQAGDDGYAPDDEVKAYVGKNFIAANQGKQT